MIDFLQAAHSKRGVLSGCFKRYLDGQINDSQQSSPPRKTKKDKMKRKRGCRTDVGAQGQGNTSQKEERITNASAGEDMQADIVKKVNPNRNWMTFSYYFPVPTCRKKKSRRYLEENGCRSKRLLSQKLCKGSCHDGTCCMVNITSEFGYNI